MSLSYFIYTYRNKLNFSKKPPLFNAFCNINYLQKFFERSMNGVERLFLYFISLYRITEFYYNSLYTNNLNGKNGYFSKAFKLRSKIVQIIDIYTNRKHKGKK